MGKMYHNSLQELKFNSQHNNITGSKKSTDVKSKTRAEHTDMKILKLKWTNVGTWAGAGL